MFFKKIFLMFILLLKRLFIGFVMMAIIFGIFSVFDIQPSDQSPISVSNFQKFEITDFDADYVLSNKDKQGTLIVTEKIKVNFELQNHGIFRYLPKKYNDHKIKLKVLEVKRNGQKEKYKKSSDDVNTEIKIGDKDVLITGEQFYEVKYRLSNVINFQDNHDELYWNINGNGWQQQFDNLKTTLSIDQGLSVSDAHQPKCFTGTYGSSVSNCEITDQDGKIIFKSSSALKAHENMTILVGFKKGYFKYFPFYDQYIKYFYLYLFAALIAINILITVMRWMLLGRDPRVIHSVIPEYAPPKDIDIFEANYLYNFNAKPKLITAAIIDFAVKGVLSIKIQKSKKYYFFNKEVVTLTMKEYDISKLSTSQKHLLRILFSKVKAGKKRIISDEPLYFEKSFKSLGRTIVGQCVHSKLIISKNKGKLRIEKPVKNFNTLVILLLPIMFYISLDAWDKNIIYSAIMILVYVLIRKFFSMFMPKRTVVGVKTLMHLKGLKLFIKTAQIDRINFAQIPNSPDLKYNKKNELQLFESLLPYAIMFGLERRWAKKFKNLNNFKPEWYRDNLNTTNTPLIISSIMRTSFVLDDYLSEATRSKQTINSSLSSSSKSYSHSGFSMSGFGGGGFSGGGGGGGGGGGW